MKVILNKQTGWDINVTFTDDNSVPQFTTTLSLKPYLKTGQLDAQGNPTQPVVVNPNDNIQSWLQDQYDSYILGQSSVAVPPTIPQIGQTISF